MKSSYDEEYSKESYDQSSDATIKSEPSDYENPVDSQYELFRCAQQNAVTGEMYSEIKIETTESENMSDILKQILHNQAEIMRRLSSLENFVRNETVHKNEFLAQTQQVRETLLISRQNLKATKQILGENLDEYEIEISTRFPISSVAGITDLEERMETREFHDSMRNYLRKLKGTSSSPEFVFRKMITDKFMELFNWDGRCGKRALNKINLFDRTLFDIFPGIGRKEFESVMRKSVERSHNRYKQQKRKAIRSNEAVE